MVRITFGGDTLKDFASGGRDQRFKLFLPHPHQDAPIVPVEAGEEWFPVWRAMDPAVRAVMRSYTVREQRREPEEVDVDFALHGADPTGADASGGPAGGPASRWAVRARPGDRAMLLGPVAPDNGGVDFRPPPGTDWVLIAADETALPAVAGILEWLPAGIGAKVWIEAQHAEDLQQLPTDADAEIVWLVRDGADPTARARPSSWTAYATRRSPRAPRTPGSRARPVRSAHCAATSYASAATTARRSPSPATGGWARPTTSSSRRP
nr:siderophore-interacting protein [Streptomyces sp.]